jgi:hypothetical protein
MKVKLITVCTDPNNEALQILKYSLEKYQWDFEILIAPEWRGFGTKLITVQQYLVNSDIDAFFFCDAYDCLALNTMHEAIISIEETYGLDKMVFSAERGCWPIPEHNVHYKPILDHGFNYLNSGLYYSPKDKFLSVMSKNPPQYADDDQLYFTTEYLFNDNKDIVLDQNCEVFQSYSFIEDDDYWYGNTYVRNLKTGTMPCIFHGNGKSDMTKLYELI